MSAAKDGFLRVWDVAAAGAPGTGGSTVQRVNFNSDISLPSVVTNRVYANNCVAQVEYGSEMSMVDAAAA